MAYVTQPGSVSRKKLSWPVVIGIGMMHLLCILAPFYFSWSAFFVSLFLIWLTGHIGITLCYHRLLTHRSFETHNWFKYTLTVIGCLAWQGGPAQWVGIHRIHHQHSDKDEDPHTPNHGFTWAHVLWCLFKTDQGRRAVDCAKDLMRDRFLRFINKYFWIFQFSLVPVLFLGGTITERWLAWNTNGLSWVIWGVCVRTVFVYHITWLINSAAHTWGYQNYQTGDRSKNVWWLALISAGESWHNNHHAFPRSAAHGLRPLEKLVDTTYWLIRLLSLVGLAWNIKLPRAEKLP
jgi:sn-1 stearoyl-lipid 9-desaturase